MVSASITVHVKTTVWFAGRRKPLILRTDRYRNCTRPNDDELRTILDEARNDNQHIMPESIYLECVERVEIV